MINMRLEKAMTNFLDRPHVMRKLKRAKLRVLSRQGGMVRKVAKRSIRPARQIRVGEMSPEQAERYAARVERAARDGQPRPRRPEAVSEPGETPRSHTGLLKKFIFYAYDPRSESVVVGPTIQGAAKDRNAPKTLEFGGRVTTRQGNFRVEPRPYMGPALDVSRPTFAAMWRNSVR